MSNVICPRCEAPLADCDCHKVSRRGFISMLGAGLVIAATPAIVAESIGTFTPTYEAFVEAAINSNPLLSAQMITREALRVLHQNTNFLGTANLSGARVLSLSIGDFARRVIEPARASLHASRR